MADRLDHLDGGQPVEAAPEAGDERPVVLVQDRHPVREPRLGDRAGSVPELLLRDRRGHHAAAVVPGRVDRERPPAGADLDQPAARAEVQLAADEVQLGALRLLERGVLAVEDAAGVSHGRVQEGGEEGVPGVVVRGDVPPAAGAGVPAQPVEDPAEGPQRGGRAAVHALERLPVPREHPDHRGQVGGGPPAPAVGLGGPDRAAPDERPPGGGVRDRHPGRGRRIAGRSSEHVERPVLPHLEASRCDPPEAVQHQAAGHPLRPGPPGRGGRRTQDSGRRSGCGWNGVFFSHSFRASQWIQATTRTVSSG